MKKGITISLIILLMVMLCTPVLAVNIGLDTDYNSEISITAVTSGSDNYSVDVEWGNMTFNYTVGGWDTENHKYITEDAAAWTSSQTDATDEAIALGTNYTLGSGQVLVRNHSNQPVVTTYDVTSAKPAGYSEVEVSISKTGDTISACPVLNQSGNEGVPYVTALVTLSGQPTYKDTATVGTLTIGISK